MWYFCIIICMNIVICPMTAAPLGNDEKYPERPDMEEFITQLLKSEMFEKLADKIAARAADKIISMQHLPQHKSARDNATPKPRSNRSIQEIADESMQEYEESKKSSNEARSDSEDQENLPENPKIETIAAVKKMSKFPVVDLSLNFKHFTGRNKFVSKPPKTSEEKEKSSGNRRETSHRKKRNKKKHKDYEVYLRAQSEIESDSESAKPYQRYEDNENYDVNVGEKNDRKTYEELPEYRDYEEITKNTMNLDSESSETQKHSDENEIKDKNEIKERLKKKASNGLLKTEDNVTLKNKSLVNYISSSILPSLKEHITSTIAIGNANTENLQTSGENKVPGIQNPAKLDSKIIRPKMQKDNKNKSNVDNQKNKDGKNTKKEGNMNIDTKHKIRESKGKLFAFVQSPDYEEYHEGVANLLKSVKNKEKDLNNVNQDLIDLMD
ncbi:hypothetical protein O0L34_g15999 [Tuta absoluta]|nr:hypothetical protein O0L34_g15999 [Tuta absoluta]